MSDIDEMLNLLYQDAPKKADKQEKTNPSSPPSTATSNDKPRKRIGALVDSSATDDFMSDPPTTGSMNKSRHQVKRSSKEESEKDASSTVSTTKQTMKEEVKPVDTSSTSSKEVSGVNKDTKDTVSTAKDETNLSSQPLSQPGHQYQSRMSGAADNQLPSATQQARQNTEQGLEQNIEQDLNEEAERHGFSVSKTIEKVEKVKTDYNKRGLPNIQNDKLDKIDTESLNQAEATELAAKTEKAVPTPANNEQIAVGDVSAHEKASRDLGFVEGLADIDNDYADEADEAVILPEPVKQGIKGSQDQDDTFRVAPSDAMSLMADVNNTQAFDQADDAELTVVPSILQDILASYQQMEKNVQQGKADLAVLKKRLERVAGQRHEASNHLNVMMDQPTHPSMEALPEFDLEAMAKHFHEEKQLIESQSLSGVTDLVKHVQSLMATNTRGAETAIQPLIASCQLLETQVKQLNLSEQVINLLEKQALNRKRMHSVGETAKSLVDQMQE